MYRFILKRLLMLIPVLLGVSFIVYTILSFTPGDPVQMMLGDNYSEESYAAMQEELGLDDPFLVQYGRFIINAVHGDFGSGGDRRPAAKYHPAVGLRHAFCHSDRNSPGRDLRHPSVFGGGQHLHGGRSVRRLHAELLAGADADRDLRSGAGVVPILQL